LARLGLTRPAGLTASGHNRRADANLEWWANSLFMLGQFPVVVVEDAQTGRLRDVTI
jgi:hypothetical protein